MISRRKRIDWDAEIKKTENIKRKGILKSSVSFAAACAFIFGISRFTGAEFQVSRKIIAVIIFCLLFCAVCAISVSIKKRRNKK